MPTSAVAAISKVAEKPTVEFPYRSRVLKITHRSRIAAPPARKEVSNKFYIGNSTTPNFGVRSFL